MNQASHEMTLRRWRSRLRPLVVPAVLALAAAEAAAAAAKPARKLVNVADTRGLPPGLSRFVADIYNTSHWQFALLAVLVMAGMGLVLGLACDRLMGTLGIHLGRIDHHE